MKIIDAHCHLPKNGDLELLLNNMQLQNVEKAVLIINTKKEEEQFEANMSIAKQNKSKLIIIAAIDIHKTDPFDFINKIKKEGFNYGIKLHSRFTYITKNDIDLVIDLIKLVDTDIVVVDCFAYGPDIETHIGLELGIRIAKAFKDKKIILAHAGGIDLLRTMLSTRSLQNIFYDLCLTVSYLFNTSIHLDMVHFLKFTNSRIMYGSDYPDFTIEHSLEKFFELFKEAKLDEKTINNIMYNNAVSIYSNIFN